VVKTLKPVKQAVLVKGYADGAESRDYFTYPELETATGEVFWVDYRYSAKGVERDFPFNSLVIIEPTDKVGFPNRDEVPTEQKRIWKLVK